MEATTQTPTPVPPLSPASPSPLYPPHLISPVTLYLPPRALSFSFSVLPGYWRAKGMLQSYWLHNRLLIPLSTKNKRTCITTGGLRKSKKAVTMKLEYRGVNMKKYCLKQLMYLASIQNAYCFNSSVDEGDPFEWKISAHLGNCFFLFFSFFLWCVFWDQGKEEKVNYADVESERHRKHFICKTEIWRIFMFFFSSFFFVIESSVFEVKSLHWKLIFML